MLLCTYLVINASLFNISISAVFFVPIFLLMFSIGGSTGIILSTNVMDIALHDSYYVVSHFHMVLSLGAINSIFSGISTLQDHLISTVSISNNTLISYVIVYLDTWYSRLNSHLNNLSMVISIVMINSSVYNMSIKVILSVVSNIFQSVTSLFISGLVRYVLFKQQQVINIGMDLVITSTYERRAQDA